MKFSGIYFGDTTLKHLAHTSSPYRKRSFLTRIYCSAIVSGFWLNFIMASAGIIFETDIYLFLMMSFWCLFIALNATISLVVLPITGTKKFQLENFLRCLLAFVKNVNLEKVKIKSRTGLTVFSFFFLSSVAGIMAGELLLDLNIGAFTPWNRWLGFRVFSPTFLIIKVGA